jgi:hypothetical protein
VVISSDGGRQRLRETKRGTKTTKGRRRYTGAWREPKVVIIYVVDAEGKRETSFAPVTLNLSPFVEDQSDQNT